MTPPPPPPPTRTTMPTYAGAAPGEECGAIRPTDKKYLVKKIIVKNIASVKQIYLNNQNINCLEVETINCHL